MSLEMIVLGICGALLSFGLNRVFNKLDDIANKFDSISKSFQEINDRMHTQETGFKDEIADLDRRVVKIETINTVNGRSSKGEY